MPPAEEGAAAAAAYRALPVRLAPGAAELRYLFVRAHRGERGGLTEDAAERTLFVAALPSWCVAPRPRARAGAHARAARSYGMFEVEALMSRFGAVERVAEVRLASLPRRTSCWLSWRQSICPRPTIRREQQRHRSWTTC